MTPDEKRVSGSGMEVKMLQLGVQTKNVVNDEHPEEGFAMLKQGFPARISV